jgi:putative radical SAM enzyme (TIGR03279 family)
MYEFAVTPAITQMRRPGVLITQIAPESLGAELDLAPNDRIVRVNGRLVRDYLDFRFQTAGETELELTVKKSDGDTWEIEVVRDEGEDFGLEFEQIVPRQCANECIFCFCKGNPEGARPSLFVRDEDIRLSFLYGNYTTLSSITDDEMKRIVEQRLSPQYVSIHATDLKTRAFLLGVDESRADISGKLNTLLENGIDIHAQVVLCPGINDGAVLEKTLRDLSSLYPGVISTAVVPVALTRYNTDERLTRVTSEFCVKTINHVEKLQRDFRKNLGVTFAFLGDEIYIKAGIDVPSRRHYGNYPQIEDGVGMIRAFLNSFDGLVRRLQDRRLRKFNDTSFVDSTRARFRGRKTVPAVTGNVRTSELAIIPQLDSSRGVYSGVGRSKWGSILTGEMFAPILKEQIARVNGIIGADLHVVAVPNTYFGGDVAVAGLLSGQDFLKVKSLIKGDYVIIPGNTIKSDEPILIDGMKFQDLKNHFDVPVLDLDQKGLINFIEFL